THPPRRPRTGHAHEAVIAAGIQMKVQTLVWPSAIALASCNRHERPPLVRAAGYLLSQQDADGGWHSQTYGLLRSAQSPTPSVLDALSGLPTPPAAQIERAIDFIRSHMQTDGALGLADSDYPDYPNYATALAVKVLCRAKRAGWEAQVAPMVAYLRTQQFTE